MSDWDWDCERAWGWGCLTTALCVALVVGTVVSFVPGVVGAADSRNEAPLADAGLDQNVTANATVYLDATGSRDPDGKVAEYEWRLEQPDGDYIRPDCRTCGQTSFVARQVGTYNATVTVTDDDGATSRDTLRVHVEESDGPSVTLSGPQALNTGEVAGYTASVSAGNADVAAVTWRVDGDWHNRTSIAGESATADYLHAFSTAGNYTLSATVVDRVGRQRTATREIKVHSPSAAASGGSSSGSGDSDGEQCSRYNRDDDRYCTNDRMTLDSNGIVITDADNDGTIVWAGQTLDAEFTQNNAGVSYDSTDGVVEFDTQEAYKEALEVDSVNVDPTVSVTMNEEEERNGMEEDDDGVRWGEAENAEYDDSNEDDEILPTLLDSIADRVGENNGGDNGDSNSGSSGEENGSTNTRTGRVPHDTGY
ncbi:PKD domain-containing protein [Halosimplex amylolyticum]|uniref:PKD domain-containing protein n=1 Tax=Halosimplex amylolyticum TaxID=3396616 RepID=UPI003F56B6C6